jgi:hypothetical protein
MNTSKTFLWLAMIGFSAAGSMTVSADNKASTAAPASYQVRSIFILPGSNKDGHDPFFPESTRVVDDVRAASKTVEITSLKVPGISGTPGHLLAIINNHTFEVGDEGDVLTSSGRVHLRCIDIRADSVLVEINGQTHRINLEAQ